MDSKVQRDRQAKRKSQKRPARDVRWNRAIDDFEGPGRAQLIQDVADRWAPQFGIAWVYRTWSAVFEWCAINPEKIAAKKDHRKFVLNWFRRDAAKERERLDVDSAVAREARVGERR